MTARRININTQPASFDERCEAWVNRLNALMLEGAALVTEADRKGLHPGAHAEMALVIYRRLAERQLDAELRAF